MARTRKAGRRSKEAEWIHGMQMQRRKLHQDSNRQATAAKGHAEDSHKRAKIANTQRKAFKQPQQQKKQPQPPQFMLISFKNTQ